MCRFIAYTGSPILLETVLFKSCHSLICQSYDSKEAKTAVNADGFGVGWYAPEIDATPGVFRSVRPLWSDENVQQLSRKIKSGLFFGHVRAATTGLSVSEENCHPFQHKNFMWMHNGAVGEFARWKKAISYQLTDDYYGVIRGTTDSEHLFALFLQFLDKGKYSYTSDGYRSALNDVILFLEELSVSAQVPMKLRLNVAVTDGKVIVAVRYSSTHADRLETLYYSKVGEFVVDASGSHLDAASAKKSVIIASEKLTKGAADWTLIEKNHFITVDESLRVSGHPVHHTKT